MQQLIAHFGLDGCVRCGSPGLAGFQATFGLIHSGFIVCIFTSLLGLAGCGRDLTSKFVWPGVGVVVMKHGVLPSFYTLEKGFGSLLKPQVEMTCSEFMGSPAAICVVPASCCDGPGLQIV